MCLIITVFSVAILITSCAARILSRTFNTDPYLQEIEQKWVLGKRSIVALIDRSNLLSQVFAGYVQQDRGPDGHNIDHAVNMGLAKHRFDSMSKPLGRLVRHIGAVIATALYICTNRKGKSEGVAAEEWLANLTEEAYIQAAMMADAADEVIMLVRICDTELADTADLPAEVATFLERVRFLFGTDGGCTQATGYTKYALEVLKHVRRFHVGKQHKSFGMPSGPSQALVKRALGRMAGWLSTVEAVVAAEFPAFDVLQSFEIFGLNDKVLKPTDAGWQRRSRRDPEDTHFKRLGQTFGVDPGKLAAQYHCFRPLALERMRSGCSSSGVAWQQAVIQTQRRQAQRDRFPCDALLPVLIAQRTFVASTSGVEQGFAKALHVVSPQQRHCFAELESDLVKVVIDRHAPEQSIVLKNAQAVWRCLYGKPRASPVQPRCDRGKLCPRPVVGTELGFLQARRAAVSLALDSHDGHGDSGTGDGNLATGPLGQELTDKQQREINFQRHKLDKRKAEAYADGLLIEQDLTTGFQLQAEAQLAKRQKTDATARRDRQRRKILSQGGAPLPDDWLYNKTTFIADGHDDELSLRRLLMTKGMIRSVHLTDAQCFVVNDPTPHNLCVQMRWAAVLAGGYVVVPSVLSYGTGPAVKFKAALLSRREVWISPAFAAGHAELDAVIRGCLAAFQGCNWRLVTAVDAADFTGQVANAAKSRRKRFVGLVLKREACGLKLAKFKMLGQQ